MGVVLDTKQIVDDLEVVRDEAAKSIRKIDVYDTLVHAQDMLHTLRFMLRGQK